MAGIYNFNVAVYPLHVVGLGVGGHITFAIVSGETGQVVYEMNGQATEFVSKVGRTGLRLGSPEK